MAEVAVSYAPTPETDLIKSTARQYLTDRFGLDVVRKLMMSDDGFDRALWQEIADLGWAGLTVPEEFGGAGYGPVEQSVILEEMGRLVTPGPFFASAVLATTAINELATAEQKRSLLPGMASGETLATLAVFEGARDWSLDRLEATADEVGGGWTISGVKHHVLDGHLADLFLVVARVGDRLGVFAVDRSADGIEITQTPVLDPTRRQASLRLDRVRVDAESLLGDDRANEEVHRVLALGSAALAVEQVGGAQACLESSVEYARTRHQFGRPIGSYQAIKHRCAEMLMRVEHARSAAYHAARVTDDAGEFSVASPLAASIASESYVWAAGEHIQILGGIGFTWEHDAHLYLKRAKSSSLLFGDPRYHRRLLATALGL